MVVSVDSMQVYRGMDIGTAKPSLSDRTEVDYELVDVADPADEYTVADVQRDGRAALDRAAAAGRPAIIAGGSGLHFRAIVDPMEVPPHDPAVRAEIRALPAADAVAELVGADPAVGAVVDLANPRRVERALEIVRLTGLTPTERAAHPDARRLAAYEPERPFVGVGVDPGDGLADRVRSRFRAMLDAGLLDEVASLAARLGPTARQAVGYKELLPVVAGDVSLADGTEAAVAATMALAKRQRTFFRRDPRLEWLPWSDDPAERWSALRYATDRVVSWTS